MERVKKSPILYRTLQYIFIVLGAAIAAFADWSDHDYPDKCPEPVVHPKYP